MKRLSLVVLPLFVLLACGHKKQSPDVSSVAVEDVHIERFDTAFFAQDSQDIAAGLHRLAREFPYFTNDFVENILGAGPLSDTNRLALQASRQFMVSYLPVKDSLEGRYQRLGWLEKELKNSFQFVKYYFPKYPLPRKVVTFIGPFDGPGIAITPFALAIGLQSYAGKNFPFYLTGKGQDMYPLYISRRFEPAYITAGCMRSIADDLFPDNSDNTPLIEQMIAKGKYWWLVDKFLPDAPDSIRTGYTGSQLGWCAANEGIIWNFFLQNTDLFTIDPEIIKNYIGEGPGTQGMPDIAPGNIGAWVGWQIVKKYADAHSGITPEQLMRIPPGKIFDEAKYKPR